jgi:hypothetical protein
MFGWSYTSSPSNIWLSKFDGRSATGSSRVSNRNRNYFFEPAASVGQAWRVLAEDPATRLLSISQLANIALARTHPVNCTSTVVPCKAAPLSKPPPLQPAGPSPRTGLSDDDHHAVSRVSALATNFTLCLLIVVSHARPKLSAKLSRRSRA